MRGTTSSSGGRSPLVRAGSPLAAGDTATGPVADVEDEADDHEEPAPTAQPVDDRVVGQDVEQGRVREDDQPEQRDEEAGEGAVDQVREDPDQRQDEPGCDPGEQCEEAAHRSILPTAHVSEPVVTPL